MDTMDEPIKIILPDESIEKKQGKNRTYYHYCIEEYKTDEHKEEDFINRFYFFAFPEICKKYNVCRRTLWKHMNGKNKVKSRKIAHLKIMHVNEPARIEIINPHLI